MVEVDVGNVVAGLMIVSVEAKTRYRMSDNALLSKSVIVRALKEVLFWMWIGHQLGAMFCQLRAQVTAIKASEPEFVKFYRGISAADHFKFQVGNDVLDRHGRVLKKILIALSA